MSEVLPRLAAEMKRLVESGEYLAFSLPDGSIVAAHTEAWIKREDVLGNPGWFGLGTSLGVAGREIDARIASGDAKVIRVGHEAVTP